MIRIPVQDLALLRKDRCISFNPMTGLRYRAYLHDLPIIADSKWVDSTHAGNIRADKGFKAIQLIQ